VTIGPDASLASALERMERRASQISALPVVDGRWSRVGHFCGCTMCTWDSAARRRLAPERA